MRCLTCGTLDEYGPHTTENCLGVIRAQADRYLAALHKIADTSTDSLSVDIATFATKSDALSRLRP